MTVELKGYYKLYPFIFFASFLMLGISATLRAFEENAPVFMKGFLLVWLVFVFIYAFRLLYLVVKLQITSDNKVIFTTITGKHYSMAAGDVLSISRKNTFANIKTTNKKFITIGNNTLFRDYVYKVKSCNPELIVKGY